MAFGESQVNIGKFKCIFWSDKCPSLLAGTCEVWSVPTQTDAYLSGRSPEDWASGWAGASNQLKGVREQLTGNHASHCFINLIRLLFPNGRKNGFNANFSKILCNSLESLDFCYEKRKRWKDPIMLGNKHLEGRRPVGWSALFYSVPRKIKGTNVSSLFRYIRYNEVWTVPEKFIWVSQSQEHNKIDASGPI